MSRFFEVNKTDENINEIENIIVGLIEDQRPNFINTDLFICRLYRGDTETHEVLAPYIEYDKPGICELCESPEYTREEL